MELVERNFYEMGGKAQRLVRDMLIREEKAIVVLEEIRVTEGNAEFRHTLREAFDVLAECQRRLHDCLNLLESILDKAGEIRKLAKEGKIEEGTIKDVESRLKYIERLFSLCKETERFLEPVQQGRLIQILDPSTFHALNKLLDACTGPPTKPIHITVCYTYTV